MNKTEKQAKLASETIANFRIIFSKGFEKRDFHTYLSSCKVPWTYQLYDIMKRQGDIYTVDGVSWFSSDSPIYYKKLEKYMLEAREKQNKYTKTYNNKKNMPLRREYDKTIIIVSKEQQIEEAIKLLKENGYRVQKPVTTFEEV